MPRGGSRQAMMPVDQALSVALVAIDHCRQQWHDDESRDMSRARRTLEWLKDQVENGSGHKGGHHATAGVPVGTPAE